MILLLMYLMWESVMIFCFFLCKIDQIFAFFGKMGKWKMKNRQYTNINRSHGRMVAWSRCKKMAKTTNILYMI